jgi:hypothetical protein
MWYGGRVRMGYTTVCRALGLLSYEGGHETPKSAADTVLSIQVGTDLPQYACMEWGTQWHAPLHADRAMFSTRIP